MKNYTLKICLLLITYILSGCAGNPVLGEKFSKSTITDIPSDKSRIVVYKKGINATNSYAGSHVIIKLGNKKVGDLIERSYITFDIAPGIHEITAGVPFGETPYDATYLFRDRTIEKDFMAGRVYFLNYKVVAKPIESYTAMYGYAVTDESHQDFEDVSFIEVNPKEAVDQLMQLKSLDSY
jgi:hypothetical protein